jgi:hypothetical protein
VLATSADAICERLPDDALVLDVGAGASPFPRADWVLDLVPWQGRGLYGYDDHGPERFGADTWVIHDVCAREPFPFADKQFDFVVCSHTLEDVRDPIWVCGELSRIAKAGYIETPSRLEEQSFGIQGPWVGWGHHRWLVEEDGAGLVFSFKHHVLCGRSSFQFPYEFWSRLTPEERTVCFWWEGDFVARERVFASAEELDDYLEEVVKREMAARGREPAPLLVDRLRRRVEDKLRKRRR